MTVPPPILFLHPQDQQPLMSTDVLHDASVLTGHASGLVWGRGLAGLTRTGLN
jgi:hypothetical protein